MTTLVTPAIKFAQTPLRQFPISPRLLMRMSMKMRTKGMRTPLATCDRRIRRMRGSPGMRTQPAPVTVQRYLVIPARRVIVPRLLERREDDPRPFAESPGRRIDKEITHLDIRQASPREFRQQVSVAIDSKYRRVGGPTDFRKDMV